LAEGWAEVEVIELLRALMAEVERKAHANSTSPASQKFASASVPGRS